MVFLYKFLYRNLKGYRFLIILAILVTCAQVGCDLLAAMLEMGRRARKATQGKP